jgi:hypothetical protein
MAVKAINNSASPDRIVSMLLVFSTYPYMLRDSLSSLSVIEQAEAIQKAIKEMQYLYTEQQIKDALSTRNSPNINNLLKLPLQSDVRV